MQNDHEILLIASVMTSASAAASLATPSEIAVLHATLAAKDALLVKREQEAQADTPHEIIPKGIVGPALLAA